MHIDGTEMLTMAPLQRVLIAALLGTNAATTASGQDAGEWAARIAALGAHNDAAFQVGPRLVEAPRAIALAAVSDAWPAIKVDGVKTGLLKAFHFAQHPDVLEVLHLGALDASAEVREYAFVYLRTFAWRDFVSDPDAYAAWRETHAGQDVEDVLHSNVSHWVKRYLAASSDEQAVMRGELDEFNLLGTPNTKTYRPSVLRYAEQAGIPRELLANSNAKESVEARRDAEKPLQSKEWFVGDDSNKRYFLHRRTSDPPPDGYKLLVVIPGGSGDENFQPFVGRLAADWLPPGYLVAQLVSKEWIPGQFQQVVWPTAKNPVEEAQFTTEEFVENAVAEIRSRERIDAEHVYVMGWSSGGPPAYAAALARDSSIRGAFILASVFKPIYLPNLAGADGKSFFMLHSPEDFIPIRMAEQARDDLQAHGARTLLETYNDGHGWPRKLDVVARGMTFLEQN